MREEKENLQDGMLSQKFKRIAIKFNLDFMFIVKLLDSMNDILDFDIDRVLNYLLHIFLFS